MDKTKKFKVMETIETDREGNRKQSEKSFRSYGQAVAHIKNRMREIIRKDSLKFFRKEHHDFTNFNDYCYQEFEFWLKESDGEQFPYVAGCLGWSCFWEICNEQSTNENIVIIQELCAKNGWLTYEDTQVYIRLFKLAKAKMPIDIIARCIWLVSGKDNYNYIEKQIKASGYEEI